MKNKRVVLAAIISLAFMPLLRAQTYAYTDRGERVILYPNHTWAYVSSDVYGGGYGNADIPNWMMCAIQQQRLNKEYTEVRLQDRNSGNNVDLVIEGRILIRINNGKISSWDFIDDYTFMNNERAPQRIDNINNDVRYDSFRNRLIRLGKYDIDYDFATEKVTRIGSYRIDYNFFNKKVSRIGSTQIEYESFNNLVESVTGRTPGLIIYIY